MNNNIAQHLKISHLYYSGTSYLGDSFIIDVIELKPSSYELTVLDSTNKVIEIQKARSLKAMTEKYNKALRYWTTGVIPGMYTISDWNRDGTFKAQPGQEIQYDIYYQMHIVVPPKAAPLKLRNQYDEAYLMGEIYDIDTATEKPIFMAFGSKNGHYYYIGLVTY